MNWVLVDSHIRLLCESYERVLGQPMIAAEVAEMPRAVHRADFALVSHGLESDPVLNYGNETALSLWEMSWAELTSTPSRLTAEPARREDRAITMERVSRDGFVTDYVGIRISKLGRRFRIQEATIWNVLSESGEYCGQAALIPKWTFL